jgi:hypothetical protein
MAVLLLSVAGLCQQRPSLTRTAEAVTVLAAENEELRVQLLTIEDRLGLVAANVDSLYREGKEVAKVPATVEEAQGLYGFLAGIVVWLFTGILSRWRPAWLSSFVLSVIVATVVTAVAYFAGGGEFTLSEAIEFFVWASGSGNILHQMKKPQQVPSTAV